MTKLFHDSDAVKMARTRLKVGAPDDLTQHEIDSLLHYIDDLESLVDELEEKAWKYDELNK